jgi:ornithine cyclodeaminase
MNDAIDVLEKAFGSPLPTTPDRSHLDVGTGDLLVMPAWGEISAGVKLVSVAPGNPAVGLPLIQGVYVLFEKPSLTPVALFDAASLTALRTAAVSGVATRCLAKEDAGDLVIFGAGVQAQAHLEAMVAVRPISRVRIVSRSPGPADALVDAASRMGLEARTGSAESVTQADIICTCSTSSEPVFDGNFLRPCAQINAVGSFTRQARELDDVAAGRARWIVDTSTAMAESGDLLAPIEKRIVRTEDVEVLSWVVAEGRGRVSDAEITVFKSVGAAFEDLVIAEAAASNL